MVSLLGICLSCVQEMGSCSRGVNLENVVVPLRAQSPSPAAVDGGGLAAFDEEQHAGVSPAELSLAWATASFRANHYGFRFPSKNTASYLFIKRGQNSSSALSMVAFFLHSQCMLKHAFILPRTQSGSPRLSIPGGWAVSGRIACLSAQVSPCLGCACQAAWRQQLSAKWQLRAEGQLGKWHAAPCMGSKMDLNAEGKGLWALCSSTGTICSGSALDGMDGLDQDS